MWLPRSAVVTGLPGEQCRRFGVTVPVAVAGVTATVNVTVWPRIEGLVFDVSVVVDDAWPTVCVRADEVLAVSFVSPLYTAVIACTSMKIRGYYEGRTTGLMSPAAADASSEIIVPVAGAGQHGRGQRYSLTEGRRIQREMGAVVSGPGSRHRLPVKKC